jgi:hypothetical protein
MITKKKSPDKKRIEPYYSDILKLSKKKQITLSAARKELIRKSTQYN